jgi:hypothetical protein
VKAAQIIAEREWVYWLDQRDSSPTGPNDPPIYRVCVVVANESGVFPVGRDPVPEVDYYGPRLDGGLYWSEEYCEETNRRRGYTPENCMRVVNSSMAVGAKPEARLT